MVEIKITFFVPRQLTPPQAMLRAIKLCRQLARTFKRFNGCGLATASKLDVAESAAEGDTRVEFNLTPLCGGHLEEVKAMLAAVGEDWLKRGVRITLMEPCPDCEQGTLVRVNKAHEVCDNCEGIFEIRSTEPKEGEEAST